MLQIVEAGLLAQGHADAIIERLSRYAEDPMGGGKPRTVQLCLHGSRYLAQAGAEAAPCTSIYCTSFSRLTDFSRFNDYNSSVSSP